MNVFMSATDMSAADMDQARSGLVATESTSRLSVFTEDCSAHPEDASVGEEEEEKEEDNEPLVEI